MIAWIKQLFAGPASPKSIDPMKYLVVGLGNIGAEYTETRHNIGFKVADALAQSLEAKFETKRYGDLAQGKYKGRKLLILKPSTYMNLSGKALLYWMKKENIGLENILVLVDDLNINFGTIRLRGKGGAGGHNGLKSIEEELGHNNYPRLRIGIGNNYPKGRQVEFVLGKWSPQEIELLPKIIRHCQGACKSYSFLGLANSMNLSNKKLFAPPTNQTEVDKDDLPEV